MTDRMAGLVKEKACPGDFVYRTDLPVPEIKEGDKIDFLCDYYTLNNEYNDSYMLGDQLTVTGQGLKVTAQDMSGEPVKKLYRFM